jgi:hypothetical protein
MSRKELPRVYELIDQMQADPLKADFQNFDKSLDEERAEKPALVCLEEELQRVDIAVWDYFKKEVAGLSRWRELMDRINELKGYLYLVSIGCEDIKPIPRSRGQTPDWQAILKDRKVLCEIKTVNTSKAEMEFRKGNKVRCPNSNSGTSWILSDRLLKQIKEKISLAEKQLKDFDASNESRRIAFIIIHFDDLLGGHPEPYFKQIEGFLRQNPVPGTSVVCYGKTSFGEGHLSFDWHKSTQCEPILTIKTP